MRKLLFILLFLPLNPVWSAIYKWVDEQGNIHYSDTPVEQAIKLRLPGVDQARPADADKPAQAEDANPAALESNPDDPPVFSGYQEFSIVTPEEGQTFRNDKGEVEIGILLSPPLQAKHKIKLHVDSTPVTPDFSTTQMILRKVSRGSHQLKAAIIDEAGTEIISAPVVNFHMRKPPRQQFEEG